MDDAILGVEHAFGQVLAAIRCERNSMVPVASLLSEILVHIFSYGTLADTLCASWVSRAWREAAINAPSLWTCLDFRIYRNFDFKSLQLARCGTLPLELHLPVGMDVEDYGHLLPLNKLSDLLPDLLGRAFSISGLPGLEHLEGVDVSRLLSLHLSHQSGSNVTFSWPRVATHALQHLCIDMRGYVALGATMPIRSLKTLHLNIADGGRVLNWIDGLPQLQELFIRFSPGFRDANGIDENDRGALRGQHGLKRLYLVDAPPTFRAVFLSRFIPSEYTNLEIFPYYTSSDYTSSLLRPQIATTLWMDQYAGVFLYDHGTSVTKIQVMGTYLDWLYHYGFPEAISTEHLTSLIVNWGHPPLSRDLCRLVNLVKLSFTFQIEKASLTDTLNQELIKGCPQLKELAMVIPNTIPEDWLTDDGMDLVVEVVKSFLKSWLLEYKVIFGVVRISDGISPQSWLRQLDAFSSISSSFEVQRVDFVSLAPAFPEPRQFVPKPPRHNQPALAFTQKPLDGWSVPTGFSGQVDSFSNTLDVDADYLDRSHPTIHPSCDGDWQ